MDCRTARRGAVLLEATREHDCGWADEDDAPSVDPESGAPWDFIHLAVERRQAVWVRAMHLLADRPHVAALVAHHARDGVRTLRRRPRLARVLRAR